MGVLMQNDSFVGGIDSSLVNKIGTAPLDTVAQDLSGAVNELKATGGGTITDVQVDGTSVVTSGVAEIDLTSKADVATTLSGYGITDAKIENGTITLGSNTITPITSHQTVTDWSPTLSWETRSKVATIGGIDIHVAMPSDPVSDKVSKSGDTMTGTLHIDDALLKINYHDENHGAIAIQNKSYAVDTSSNNGIPSGAFHINGLDFVDSNELKVGGLQSYAYSSGAIYSDIFAYDKKTDGSSVSNRLRVGIAKNGTCLYEVTDPAAFRSAIGAGTSSTNTTYTIATGDNNGQIKVTPSSGSAYNVSVKGLGNAAYIGTPVSIANGGTGKTTAADARTALSTPAMTTETYPALLPTNGSNNWIKIGTSNTSYGIIPSREGGSTSGHNYIGTSTWYWGYAYVQDIFCNKIQATSTQDASGTANNKPALIVGGSDTQAHIEIDANEIIAKSNGNTAGTLYLQDGGTLALSATSYSVSNAANFRSAISAQAALSTTTTTPAGAALAKYGNVVWLPIWGVAGNNIGTIPAAYRPKVPCRALVYCIDTGGHTYVGVAEVSTSGVFKCWYYKTYGSGTSTDGTNASTKVYGEMIWITA